MRSDRQLHPPTCVGAAVRQRSLGGFTIVEMLVVIAIITILIALVMPALRSVRISSQQTSEMSTARQLMGAYHAYANTNRDHLLTGVAPAGVTVFDEDGRLLTDQGLALRTYPWRIAPYLNFDMRGLYVNQHRELLEQLRYETFADYIYKVGLTPSLGLNTQWIGGDSHGVTPPAFLPPTDENGNPNQEFNMWHGLLDMRRYYVTRMSHVVHPNRLIAFASARSPDTTGLAGPNEIIQGNYRIRSPYTSELNPKGEWAPFFDVGDDPSKFGHVSPRYFRTAVTAFIDGSVDTLDTRQLRDMRHWANWATHEDWMLPKKQN